MVKIMKLFAVMLMLLFVSTHVAAAAQPGKTDRVFNKKFIQKLKPMMPYEQLVKIVGIAGIKTSETKNASAPVLSYHWNGGRGSALDVKTTSGKVVEATVLSPNKRKLTMDKTGKIVD